MDKLEKALQKARQQREVELQKQIDQQEEVRRQKVADLPPPMQATSNQVDISPDYMQRHHIISHQPRNKEADQFRILRTQILQHMGQSGMRTLGITSANYGDGKSTVALNLAVSIAMDLKQTVLLVDMDLRKPSVTEYLGVEAPNGITEYFEHNTPIADCMLRTNFERLNILPAGQRREHSSEVLGSPKIAQLAQELKKRYEDRIIIYDLPPILAQDDSIAFLPHVEAVLLVINDGSTRVSAIKQSMALLSSAHVIGTVLNSSDLSERTGLTNWFTRKLEATYEKLKRSTA